MVRPAWRAGALASKRAAGAGRAEAGLAVVAVCVDWGCRRIGAACCAGQVTTPAARSIWNWSLVKCPLGCDRGLDLDPWVDAGGVQAGQQRPGAIGAVTIDRGR